MIVMVLIALPLLVLVSSAMITMTTRTSGQTRWIHGERAMLAIESGLDQVLYISRTVGLVSGTPISRTLGPDYSFVVEPVLCSTDGVDNDGDGLFDEADEDVWQLTITGTYARVTRKVVAYLGKAPGGVDIEAAVLTHNTTMVLDHDEDTPEIRGDDKNINGSAGPQPALPGVAIAPPGTVADLQSYFDPCPGGRITGTGPHPNFAQATAAFDFATMVPDIQAAATALTSSSYSGQTLGNASANDWRIYYRNGDVEFEDDTTGAGILLVNGRFEADDDFRWDGIVIVIGNDPVKLEDDAKISGALILGPTVPELEMEDDAVVQYSSEAVVAALNIAPGQLIVLNGWQEISIYEPTGGPGYIDPVIGSGADIHSSVTFGSACVIGDNAEIDNHCTFGNNVQIGDDCDIDHHTDFGSNISVGDDLDMGRFCDVGNNVTIGNNVTVGNNVQVGAGATITNGSSVPSGTVIPPGSTY